MIVKINAFSVFIIFFSKTSTKRTINYFFGTYTSNCSNMKVQNAFLTKFIIVKLKIDAFSIFIIFLKCFTKEFTDQLFLQSNSWISHYSTGASIGICQGKEEILELEHLDKHFIQNTRRNVLQGKISGFFSYYAIQMRNLADRRP